MAEKSGAAKKRQDVKNDYWPNEDAWTGEGEVGWFKGSRTLPLFLSLLNEKAISGNNDPRSTYVELLSRQMGEGIIDMGHEKDHAFAAGYSSTRGVRTWTDNMKILEANGFIRIHRVAGRCRYVLIVHPTTVIQRLVEKTKVSQEWLDAYNERRRETKEPSYEQRQKKIAGKAAVIPIKTAVAKKTAEAAKRKAK